MAIYFSVHVQLKISEDKLYFPKLFLSSVVSTIFFSVPEALKSKQK